MGSALAISAIVLSVAGLVLLAILTIHWVMLAVRNHRAMEKNLMPLALTVAFDDDEIPELSHRDAAIFAPLLGRYSTRLQGASRKRISEYFERHGHVRGEMFKLSNRRPWRRATAAYILGDMGSRSAADALVTASQDPQREVRAAAARSLGLLRSPESAPALAAMLVAQSVPRGIIGQAILTVGPEAVQHLVPLLNNSNPELRATAAELLGFLGQAGETEALIKLLGDSSESVREQAAMALGRIGSAAACESLGGALTDPSPRVKAAAAEALGVIGNSNAFPILLDLTRDHSFRVGRAAAQAAASIDPARFEQAAHDPAASEHVLEMADLVAIGRED